MNGVTAPVIRFTVTIRELLFCPPPWVDWLESVAKSRPPERPLTKAMSIAGPAGWNPPPPDVGLPNGPRISVPLRLKTKISGVKGLVELKVPPTMGLSCSLHRLPPKPCPDSRTNTWKFCESPRNAIPVGKFRPEANTDAVKPGGRTIDGDSVGLKLAVLSVQIGFATTLLAATAVNDKNGVTTKAAVKASDRFTCILGLLLLTCRWQVICFS